MSRIVHIVAVGLISMFAAAQIAKAGPYYYANPALVDLSKDRNVSINGGAIPILNSADSYQLFARTDFTGVTSATYTVDLGQAAAVGNISFVPYTEGGSDWGSTDWNIETSATGASWTPVSSGAVANLPYNADAAGDVIRYVRLNATGFRQGAPGGGSNNWFIVKGLHIYGQAGSQIAIRDTLNLAGTASNGTTATITDASNNTINDQTHINDQDPNDGTFPPISNTFGLNNGNGLGSQSEVASSRDITFSFTSAYALKGIRWSSWAGQGTPDAYTVYASLGGGLETLVRTYSGVGILATFYDAFDGAYGIDGIAADKLRVHVTSVTGTAYPEEVEVFGSALPEPTGASLILCALTAGIARRRRAATARRESSRDIPSITFVVPHAE